MTTLAGKVAIVTGASRGIGKGIAVALGSQGAVVYVTGRTVTPRADLLSGTVTETAAEVDRRGGKGIAVQVDHWTTIKSRPSSAGSGVSKAGSTSSSTMRSPYPRTWPTQTFLGKAAE